MLQRRTRRRQGSSIIVHNIDVVQYSTPLRKFAIINVVEWSSSLQITHSVSDYIVYTRTAQRAVGTAFRCVTSVSDLHHLIDRWT